MSTVARTCLAPLAAAALAVAALIPAGADAGVALRVVNGTPLAPGQVPWQVAVRWTMARTTTTTVDPDGRVTTTTLLKIADCGGAVLDATRILTAAHCFLDEADPGRRAAPADVAVNAGTAQKKPADDAVGVQRAAVAAIAIHPHYAPAAREKAPDVAVVTLAAPLDLTGPYVGPATLPGATDRRPGAGTPLTVSGFGEGTAVGTLHGGEVRTVKSTRRDCRQLGGPSREALTVCARAAPPTFATTCNGDSGGPVTLVGTSTLAGIVSRRSGPCGSGTMAFVDVAAPEIRAFVDGARVVPYAPRSAGGEPARLSGRMSRGRLIRCASGRWRHATRTRYTFAWAGTPGRTRQSGASRLYRLTRADFGRRLRCTVTVSSPGGSIEVVGELGQRTRR